MIIGRIGLTTGEDYRKMAEHNIRYRHLDDAYSNCLEANKRGCDCFDLLEKINRLKRSNDHDTELNRYLKGHEDKSSKQKFVFTERGCRKIEERIKNNDQEALDFVIEKARTRTKQQIELLQLASTYDERAIDSLFKTIDSNSPDGSKTLIECYNKYPEIVRDIIIRQYNPDNRYSVACFDLMKPDLTELERESVVKRLKAVRASNKKPSHNTSKSKKEKSRRSENQKRPMEMIDYIGLLDPNSKSDYITWCEIIDNCNTNDNTRIRVYNELINRSDQDNEYESSLLLRFCKKNYVPNLSLIDPNKKFCLELISEENFRFSNKELGPILQRINDADKLENPVFRLIINRASQEDLIFFIKNNYVSYEEVCSYLNDPSALLELIASYSTYSKEKPSVVSKIINQYGDLLIDYCLNKYDIKNHSNIDFYLNNVASQEDLIKMASLADVNTEKGYRCIIDLESKGIRSKKPILKCNPNTSCGSSYFLSHTDNFDPSDLERLYLKIQPDNPYGHKCLIYIAKNSSELRPLIIEDLVKNKDVNFVSIDNYFEDLYSYLSERDFLILMNKCDMETYHGCLNIERILELHPQLLKNAIEKGDPNRENGSSFLIEHIDSKYRDRIINIIHDRADPNCKYGFNSVCYCLDKKLLGFDTFLEKADPNTEYGSIILIKYTTPKNTDSIVRKIKNEAKMTNEFGFKCIDHFVDKGLLEKDYYLSTSNPDEKYGSQFLIKHIGDSLSEQIILKAAGSKYGIKCVSALANSNSIKRNEAKELLADLNRLNYEGILVLNPRDNKPMKTNRDLNYQDTH